MKPLLLKPILDKTIWGGNRLATIRNHPENIGTWWEVSAHSYGSNEITNLDEKTTLRTWTVLETLLGTIGFLFACLIYMIF